MESVRTAFGWLALAALLGGCGGGDGSGTAWGSGGGPTTQSLDVAPDAANTGITTGGGMMGVLLNLNVGDLPTNFDIRGHLSFPLANIPATATIVRATLRCSQTGVGGNPYGEIGTLDVDHIEQGAGLDVADHASAALTANIGALSADAQLVIKGLDVTAQVVADIAAGRPNSDFRLLFTAAPSVDGNPDSVFLSAQNPGEELLLRVIYTVP